MRLWAWLRRYLSCPRCHGTGVFTDREVLPRHRLSPRDRADVLVNGGYFYRPVKKVCDQPMCPATARKR